MKSLGKPLLKLVKSSYVWLCNAQTHLTEVCVYIMVLSYES